MKKRIASLVLIFAVGACQADIILRDLFDSGNLATYFMTGGQTNGGFNIIGSGGSALEDGSSGKATISNAPNGSPFGILSAGTVSLGGAPKLKTTWIITDSSLKDNAESLVFTWQLGTDLETSPAVALVLDAQNSEAYLLTTGNTNGIAEIDFSFGATNDAFAVVTELSLDRYDVAGTGALKTRSESEPIAFGAEWASGSPALENIYVGAYVNGKSNNGLVVEFDSVTVETIPEPAVISLISLAGGGMIFYRRIFSARKKNTDV